MKTLSNKLFALTLAAALAAGCASVTDAGVQPDRQPVVEQTAPAPTPDHVMGGSESEPIVDEPVIE